METARQLAEEIKGKVKGYLPQIYQETECEVVERAINNGIYMTGIQFHEPGNRVNPVIYMEPYFEKYGQGISLDEIAEAIAGQVQDAYVIGERLPATGLKNLEYAKDYLKPVLLNEMANWQTLPKIPHIKVEDLAVVCRIMFPLKEDLGSGCVTEEYLKQWGIGREELFQMVLDRASESGNYILYDMEEWLKVDAGDKEGFQNLLWMPEEEIREKFGKEPDILQKTKMYVLANRRGKYGAAAIACRGIMEKVDRIFPEGFYILPSSIHECIIVRKGGGLEVKELEKMVRNINMTPVVKTEEILSDHVYEYDRERGSIRLAAKERDKERGMER